jgi:hypothetical protein
LGKTIEAGLVIQELRARGKAKKIIGNLPCQPDKFIGCQCCFRSSSAAYPIPPSQLLY